MISAGRHAIVGPAHTSVRGFPESRAGVANASRSKGLEAVHPDLAQWRVFPLRWHGSATAGIDRAEPCEDVVDRLADALTIELSKKGSMVTQGQRPLWSTQSVRRLTH